MSTAIVHEGRPWLSVVNLLLGGGAAVLALIAITTDDVAPNAFASVPSVVADPSASLLDRMATFRDEVAAEDACRRARADEPC